MYPGKILAAHTLQSLAFPIHTNLALVFRLAQAIEYSQAKVAVMSPFIGRAEDGWDVTSELANPGSSVKDHPRIKLVREIRRAYARAGAKTQVMAAGFRTVDEIIELGKFRRKGGRNSSPSHLSCWMG